MVLDFKRVKVGLNVIVETEPCDRERARKESSVPERITGEGIRNDPGEIGRYMAAAPAPATPAVTAAPEVL